MDAPIDATGDVAAVRAVIDAWAAAVRDRDVEQILSTHAADAVGFDCTSRLRLNGIDDLRQHLEACFAACGGPTVFEFHDLEITANADLAFCHGFIRGGGTGPDGVLHIAWLRMTACLRRTERRWRIVHAHCSAPFDPETGAALLDLPPA